jgi:hypothetical protein
MGNGVGGCQSGWGEWVGTTMLAVLLLLPFAGVGGLIGEYGCVCKAGAGILKMVDGRERDWVCGSKLGVVPVPV